MRKIALYDIDYTLIPYDSFLRFIFYIIRHYPLKLFYLGYVIFFTFVFLFGFINLTKYKERWLIFIKGISTQKLEELSRKFIETRVIPSLKPGVAENVKSYKDKGYTIVFATASFEFYFRYLAEHFEVDYFFGTRLEEPLGTGRPLVKGLNCKGQEKIRRIVKELKAEEIDIPSSVSFSDSNSDLPFLDLTGTFYKIHKKKWLTLEERCPS